MLIHQRSFDCLYRYISTLILYPFEFWNSRTRFKLALPVICELLFPSLSFISYALSANAYVAFHSALRKRICERPNFQHPLHDKNWATELMAIDSLLWFTKLCAYICTYVAGCSFSLLQRERSENGTSFYSHLLDFKFSSHFIYRPFRIAI